MRPFSRSAPAPAWLTRAILALGARKVIAIERDTRCLPALAEIADHYPGWLEVIEGDALKTDFETLAPEGPIKIIANLPYNVGTQLWSIGCCRKPGHRSGSR
ncbi:rRNA adenine N-6-methyltransferase family protein [Rhizobium beringeri]